ncbi:hypothetical protein BLNAU_21430 [Blattamonas nauphoetae]|uniref:Uncharacterized protein n=1 Tax=Blattamonas nauphoetae TaxID=2049346 RepID=A0ABQ9WVV8_9EUKA|nr:hypothetical protein BLNAU_21430 [Blattamonas nauphoetae]
MPSPISWPFSIAAPSPAKPSLSPLPLPHHPHPPTPLCLSLTTHTLPLPSASPLSALGLVRSESCSITAEAVLALPVCFLCFFLLKLDRLQTMEEECRQRGEGDGTEESGRLGTTRHRRRIEKARFGGAGDSRLTEKARGRQGSATESLEVGGCWTSKADPRGTDVKERSKRSEKARKWRRTGSPRHTSRTSVRLSPPRKTKLDLTFRRSRRRHRN